MGNDDNDISCKMLCTGFASCQYQPDQAAFPTTSRSMYVVEQIDELVCSDISACQGSEFILIGAVCDDDADNSFQCECGVRIQCGDANNACGSGYFKMVMPNDEFFIACEGDSACDNAEF